MVGFIRPSRFGTQCLPKRDTRDKLAHDGSKTGTTAVNAPTTSHYPSAPPAAQKIETHTLSVLVDNEPGVLARVIGLFSGRGYNIESLTVSETEHQAHLSLVTIVTTGTPMVIEQIKNQLDRLVPVHRVVDMTLAGNCIERELAMVKVRGKGEHRVEALRLADAFRARVIDATIESFVFEITGASDKIEQFVALMLPLGLVEVARTGIAAIRRGPDGL
jgi:acetolactate synthase I/III small subunit